MEERNIIQEQSDFLDETFKYYTENPERRCVGKVGGVLTCAYNPVFVGKEDVSEGCAVGRVMTQEQKGAVTNNNLSVSLLPTELFPTRLSGFNIGFLSEVQWWHDDVAGAYWNSDGSGLTQRGHTKIADIRRQYCTA